MTYILAGRCGSDTILIADKVSTTPGTSNTSVAHKIEKLFSSEGTYCALMGDPFFHEIFLEYDKWLSHTNRESILDVSHISKVVSLGRSICEQHASCSESPINIFFFVSGSSVLKYTFTPSTDVGFTTLDNDSYFLNDSCERIIDPSFDLETSPEVLLRNFARVNAGVSDPDTYFSDGFSKILFRDQGISSFETFQELKERIRRSYI